MSGGVWCVYIKVAASSPAWLTRRALSRNSCCSEVKGRRRFAFVPVASTSGFGSAAGDIEEAVVEAWRHHWAHEIGMNSG